MSDTTKLSTSLDIIASLLKGPHDPRIAAATCFKLRALAWQARDMEALIAGAGLDVPPSRSAAEVAAEASQ